jgi:threonine synthase
VIVARCASCGVGVDATVLGSASGSWRCPAGVDRHHELVRVPVAYACIDDPHPFIRYDPMLMWARVAEARGLDADARARLVRRVDRLVADIDGTGVVAAGVRRLDALSELLGFDPGGGIWSLDVTADVAGSAKARHLMSILLTLIAGELAGERDPSERARTPLAIASCGNAALAAATLAAAVNWPIEVYVPTTADEMIVSRLHELGATVNTCSRDGDVVGDPCLHAFRHAVDQGAVPFSVQGTDNALCLDGGRTYAYECAEVLGVRIDRVFVPVGGGALAASLAMGFADCALAPRLHPVQAQGCAPLARALGRWREGATSWDDCMWPWEPEPHSIASGILDDEAYDWQVVVEHVAATGGDAVTVTETQLVEANRLVNEHTTVDADETGTASLAGLLAWRGQVGDDEVVVVPITGIRRIGATDA